MVPDKIIRIDQEVYDQLKALASPFEDSPNRVLRKVFGLDTEKLKKDIKEDTNMDLRISKLVDSIQCITGQALDIRPIKNPQFSFRSKVGVVFAHLDPQKKRLKITVKKSMAQSSGCTGWDKIQPNGWFKADDEAVWYIPNNDAKKNEQVAKILARIWG